MKAWQKLLVSILIVGVIGGVTYAAVTRINRGNELADTVDNKNQATLSAGEDFRIPIQVQVGTGKRAVCLEAQIGRRPFNPNNVTLSDVQLATLFCNRDIDKTVTVKIRYDGRA